MLLMVEKGIRGGMYHSIHWYAKASNKSMKDYNKNKESAYTQYWDVNNLYGWAMSQKLSVNSFEWIKDTYQFNEVFIKKVIKNSFSKLVFNILKNYIKFIVIYHFHQKEWKLKKSKSL